METTENREPKLEMFSRKSAILCPTITTVISLCFHESPSEHTHTLRTRMLTNTGIYNSDLFRRKAPGEKDRYFKKRESILHRCKCNTCKSIFALAILAHAETVFQHE